MSSGRAAWDGPRQSKEYPLHVKTIACLTKEQVLKVLALAKDMKAAPHKYSAVLKQKTLLMLFEKPSLRTRVSFETGMTQLGGHAIHYNIADSPLGKKESIQVFIHRASTYYGKSTWNI
jgi:ornithine carbamoyltransferase